MSVFVIVILLRYIDKIMDKTKKNFNVSKTKYKVRQRRVIKQRLFSKEHVLTHWTDQTTKKNLDDTGVLIGSADAKVAARPSARYKSTRKVWAQTEIKRPVTQIGRHDTKWHKRCIKAT